MEDLHQIEVGVLELDPLASQLVPDELLLLLDILGPVGDLLENDLHHVHLADGEASHLRQCLLLHVLVARCFELRKLLLDVIKGLLLLLSFRNHFANVPWVEGYHRVGLEVELVGCADNPVFGRLWPCKEVLTILVRFFN